MTRTAQASAASAGAKRRARPAAPRAAPRAARPDVAAELRRAADEIARMRAEIALLRVVELKTERLPTAGRQIGEIASATEGAANAILEAAEELLAAEPEDVASYKALVVDKVMAIFEACAFQDLTGQLLARVGDTVSQVETRIGRFADALDAGDAAADEFQGARARELLLNGPQLREAISQSDVDQLFDAPARA